jgi:D-threo-aldose 1-dehydrogenase
MQEVTLGATGIVTTRIGFGCGGLMRIPFSPERQRIVHKAIDEGIRHFDVARMYGLGATEKELGKAITGKRDRLVIATKFGIEFRAGLQLLAPVQSLARLAFRMLPRPHAVARGQPASAYTGPRRYDPDTARRSLEASLRALRTEYVDLLLLHEPSHELVVDTGVLEFLTRARDKGQIRAWGVAGYPEQLGPLCAHEEQLAPVIQVPNDILGRQADQFRDIGGPGVITFSPWSAALGLLRDFLASNLSLRDEWSKTVDLNLADSENLGQVMLAWCLDSNPDGVVLFGTEKLHRITTSVSTVDDKQTSKAGRALAELVIANCAAVERFAANGTR